jgi:uncharacterized membrane protein YkvA (DUF1232 family)
MLRIGAGLALVADVWLLLIVAATRLAPGLVLDLVRLLPDCATLLRRLWRDPALPLGSRLLLGGAALWVVSPIDLVPEFLPVVGALDDVVVVAVALRLALRRVPPEVLLRAWPGDPGLLARLLPQLAGDT